MKNNSPKKIWTIFGAGNFIFDIIDAIEANGEEVGQIVANMGIHKQLKPRIQHLLVKTENFKPQKGHTYIFGFLHPEKESFLKTLKKHRITFSNVIHPRAYLAKGVEIGEGNFFGAGVVIGPSSKIGSHNYFNRGSLIGHDTVIGNYNHFGPGSIVCGRCNIGHKCNLGAGSVINDGIIIGSKCITGSLACVVRDAKLAGTYVGVPAKRIKS